MRYMQVNWVTEHARQQTCKHRKNFDPGLTGDFISLKIVTHGSPSIEGRLKGGHA